MNQLPLFDEPDDRTAVASGRSSTAADASSLEQVYQSAREIAARVPPGVRFGTSSWSFPGWKGIVYERDLAATSLSREGLREYSRHPLLRTVGIDRSYYAPIPVEDLKRYADQLPAGFPCCIKAPAAVTAAFVGGRGAALQPNPTFLSADHFIEEVLEPCTLVFCGHAGPFIFECPAVPRDAPPDASMFADRLDMMLDQLPREFRYAVELRDRSRLTGAYGDVLRRHGVAHTYNYWSDMPMPLAQAGTVPIDVAPFVVVRLLLRPGTWYEESRERFRPFNRLVAPDDIMRDEVVELARRTFGAGRDIFVLVNNKAEGSAPLTIAALARRLADALSGPTNE